MSPSWPTCRSRALTPHDGALDGESDYDTMLFERAAFDDLRLAYARFLECAFRTVTISDGRLPRSSLQDVWLRDVVMTGTNMAESQWQDVTVIGSSLAGIQVFGAELRRVVFSGCKLDSVNSRGRHGSPTSRSTSACSSTSTSPARRCRSAGSPVRS